MKSSKSDQSKFIIVQAGSFTSSLQAFRLFADGFWDMIDGANRRDPHDPALHSLLDAGHVLDLLLEGFQKSILTEPESIKHIFGSDYLLLNDETKEQFLFGFTPNDDDQLH